MDKEQNSNKDEDDNDDSDEKFEVIVLGVYITPIFIGMSFLATICLTIGFSNFDIFLGLCVFNGIAVTFIVLIFIVSFIKLLALYDGAAVRLGFFFICFNWIICFLGAISIICVFGFNNITNNIFYELHFVFFTFISFSVITDIIVLLGASGG